MGILILKTICCLLKFKFNGCPIFYAKSGKPIGGVFFSVGGEHAPFPMTSDAPVLEACG